MGKFWTILAVVLVAASCGDDSGGEDATTPADAGGQTDEATDAGGDACPTGDFEGAFEEEEMQQFIDCVLPSVVDWVDYEYGGAASFPDEYVFLAEGETNPACDGVSDASLAYCPADRSVYLGQVAVFEQYSQFGDAAPVIVLAHEVTHHLQNFPGYPQPQSPNDVIPSEDQADCGAGAFFAYAEMQGYVDFPDDLKDLANSLAAAGEAEGPDRTHGTIDERLQAFDTGREGGLSACNAFVPEAPIIVGLGGTSGTTGTSSGSTGTAS